LIDGGESPIDTAKPIPLLTGGWNFDQDESFSARGGDRDMLSVFVNAVARSS
jgi:hypothetical protein